MVDLNGSAQNLAEASQAVIVEAVAPLKADQSSIQMMRSR